MSTKESRSIRPKLNKFYNNIKNCNSHSETKLMNSTAMKSNYDKVNKKYRIKRDKSNSFKSASPANTKLKSIAKLQPTNKLLPHSTDKSKTSIAAKNNTNSISSH